MKFLFDLFPVILFFITYKIASPSGKAVGCLISNDVNQSLFHEPILVATLVAIIATLLQVTWLILRKKKIEKIIWLSLGVIVTFGSATLYFRNPTFIQWKPTVLYWLISSAMAFSTLVLRKNPIQEAMQEQISLPTDIWKKLNLAWIGFFAVMGGANLCAVHLLDCDAWVSFKTYGLMGLMFVFSLAQAFALSKYVEET